METIGDTNPTKTGAQIPFSSGSSTAQDVDSITLPTIPHELIAEILLRLPVKSLIRFKCVSRSWLSLISSDAFVKSHLKFDAKTDNQKVLTLRSVGGNYHLKHCSLNYLLYENATDAIGVDVDYPPFEPRSPLKFISVVGYCDGLFCVVIRGLETFLWNPSTRKSKKLPCFRNTLKQNYYIAWGFGYDVVTDDYKVVAVACLYHDYGDLSGTKVMVYSIKTETWRRIGDFPVGYPWEDSGKFVNGKLHWLLHEDDCGCIVTLDLATEAYSLLEKPNFGRVYDHYDSRLHIFKGCLCLLCGENGDDVDVWVMKEYGVRGSWCMVLRLPFSKPRSNLVIRPLCMSDKGEVLLVLATKLMLYNPNDVSNICLGYWDENIRFYDAFEFAESLVSPHRY